MDDDEKYSNTTQQTTGAQRHRAAKQQSSTAERAVSCCAAAVGFAALLSFWFPSKYFFKNLNSGKLENYKNNLVFFLNIVLLTYLS